LYGLIQKLQSAQNAAARLITGVRRRDHISHVLVQLHWLPVWWRAEYKVACLVHQSLSGQASANLTDDINIVADSGHRILRSASYHIPTIHTVTRVSLLLVCMCGTVCHHTTHNHALATDYISKNWKHFYSGINWPRCTATVSSFVCDSEIFLLKILTYLFTQVWHNLTYDKTLATNNSNRN